MRSFEWKPYRSAFLTTLVIAVTAQAQTGTTSVLTAQFNNGRTGANLTESVLNVSNVNVSSFGKLYSFSVDGYVYAQPLYVASLNFNGASRNVLYVATMHNSVYAFDADAANTPPLFQISLGPPVPATSSPCPDYGTTGPELGILSTPVIDLATNTLYAVSATPASGGGYSHRIFGVDIITGQIKLGPVVMSPSVTGTGTDSQNGQVIMNQTRYLQRPGLLLTNGTVYAGFGGCGPDPSPYHGWVVGYNAGTLQQTAVYNASPNGDEAAIWQSGRGLVGDISGNVYAMTGNGSYDASSNFADSFLKLSSAGALLDWFTPADWPTLDDYDLDLSSSGPILTPDSNLLIGGGKEGILYVLNPSLLGGAGPPLQQFQATRDCGPPTSSGCYQIHSIAYLNGSSSVYVWGSNDILRAYQSASGQFRPASQNAILAGFPGGMLAVSSQGTQPGTSILWAVDPNGVVHAFDATDVADELWNSTQNSSRDSLGAFAKFGQPIIADGKVFVPTFSNAVVAYGLLTPPAAPTGLTFTIDFSASGQVSLLWTDNSNNETGFSIERSTDGVTFTQIATVGANTTTYTDSALALYTPYWYRVRSYNQNGYSAYSNIVQYLAF